MSAGRDRLGVEIKEGDTILLAQASGLHKLNWSRRVVTRVEGKLFYYEDFRGHETWGRCGNALLLTPRGKANTTAWELAA